MINGMLRRFTGCAHLRLRLRLQRVPPRRVEPMLGSIGRQKFTKALVLSGGASVVEVDVAHAPRARPSRYSPLRLTRSRCTCSPASGRSRSSGRRRARRRLHARAVALGIYGVVFWIDESNFPGRSSAARSSCSSSASRDSSSRSSASTWAESSATWRAAAVHDREEL
jgi:hypothetical protein